MKGLNSNPFRTILTITIGFLFVHIIFDYKWALFTAIFVGVAGVLSFKLSKFIELLWDKLTQILGLIVPNIILGLVFYFFLLPISVLSKVFSKRDLLNLKNNKGSLFLNVNKNFSKESFEKMW